jgi:acyl-CoA thioester hydrolase
MEKPLTKEFEVKWADLDPNRHMRHSAYNDYAAHMRVKFFEEAGLTISKMEELRMGPILFREETKFYSEVGMQGNITMTAALLKARDDGSRWSFIHEMYRADGIHAATVIVDGAWLDLDKRKLYTPPSEIGELFLSMPKTEGFELTPAK